MHPLPHHASCSSRGLQRLPCEALAVDLWWLRASDLPLDCIDLLPEEELSRSQLFHFESDRQAFLAKRLLVRTVLSRYAPVHPSAWRFVATPHGRPELAPNSPNLPLSFNLSNSGDVAVCAISPPGLLGVDIEHPTRLDPQALPDWVLAPGERRHLEQISPAARPAAFLHYWTLKEAYVKARGLGLNLPVDQIAFTPPEAPSIRLDLTPTLDDAPAAWIFARLPLPGDFLVALAYRPS